MRIGLPQEGLVCYKRSWIKGMKKKAEPPTTLVEFSQMFPNERACWDYLFAVRWPEGFICPRCGEHGGYIIEGRRVVECSAAKCRYHCSLTAGTVLHRTKQSLLSWFWAVYLVTSMTPGISAQQLQRQAANQLRQDTATPTLRWVFQLMDGIAVVHITMEGLHQTIIPTLSPTQAKIVEVFGGSVAFITGGPFLFHRVGPPPPFFAHSIR